MFIQISLGRRAVRLLNAENVSQPSTYLKGGSREFRSLKVRTARMLITQQVDQELLRICMVAPENSLQPLS